MNIKRNVAITLICILLGIMLAWQYKSIDFNQKAALEENKRADDYKNDYIEQSRINKELMKKNAELKEENDEFLKASGNVSQITQKLMDELKTARIFAGMYDVKGKGVIITLDYDQNNEFSYIEDSEILLLLNELRASDAQAISVNDERIVATSEVREAGRYMMINGRQMLPPFVVKAIADPDKIESSLRIVGGILEELELYMKVSIEKSDNITIPKVRDDGTVIRTDLLNPVEPK